MRGLYLFLARLFSTKHRDLFIVRLGTYLLLAKFGITGRLADFLGLFLRGAIGLLIESGIFQIDLTLDAYREGQKLKQFKKLASKAYKKATAKVYSEEEKIEIRKEYLKIISLIGTVGNPK